MTELSDQSLLAHWYRHRNAEAFHVLAARHARMVYATALRVLRDAQAAEDVSQESFLALAQAKRPPSRNVAAWLHRTAYHAALDVIRSGKRRHARDLDYAAMQPHATHTTWDDMRGLVDEAVASLPEAWREPLVRHFFEQESHAAIAAALGIPRQTVTHRIGKGIERVRQQLKDKGVIVPAGALLAALIQENSASALPVSAAAGIGRIALAATPSLWAVLATYTAGAAFKTAAAMLVVGVGGWAMIQMTGHGPSTTPESVASAKADASKGFADAVGESKLAKGDISTKLENVHSGLQDASLVTAEPIIGEPQDQAALASIAGTVTVPNGRPLSGAKVRIVVAANLATGKYGGTSTFDLDADAQGKFEQHDIPRGEYSILVREKENNLIGPSNELARITLAPGEHNEDLKLVFGTEGNLTVSGTVVDGQGRPLEAVRVTKFDPVSRGALTDNLGRFTLRYLPDDGLQLNVDKEGYIFGAGLLTVHAGDQNVRVVLHRGGAVEGRVVDARTHEPVKRFGAIFRDGHLSPTHLQAWDSADSFDSPDGSFKFSPLYYGDITVAVRAPGYGMAVKHAAVGEGEKLQGLVIELEADEGAVRSGRVVTSDGSPIAGARIAMGRIAPPDDRDKNVVAVTDALGEFRAEGVPRETALLYAWHREFAPASRLADSDEDIVLKKAGRLIVEVFSGGVPLPKMTAGAQSLAEPNLRYMNGVATGQDGRAILEEVIPGRVLVHVELGYLRVQKEMVSLAPGEEKSLRFDVAPAVAAVEGTVYCDGAPLSGGSVQLEVDTGTGRERQLQDTASDGTFSFRNVPLGKAQLMAAPDSYSQHVFLDDVELTSGEVTSLSIDVTPERMLRGTVSGIRDGERAAITVLRGAMSLDDAVNVGTPGLDTLAIASRGIANDLGIYESPLVQSGTYTVLLSTFPDRSYALPVPRESRIVEVPENGELNVDFSLPR